jgi:hypothetical protein
MGHIGPPFSSAFGQQRPSDGLLAFRERPVLVSTLCAPSVIASEAKQSSDRGLTDFPLLPYTGGDVEERRPNRHRPRSLDCFAPLAKTVALFQQRLDILSEIRRRAINAAEIGAPLPRLAELPCVDHYSP